MAFPLSGLGRVLTTDSADSYYHQFHRALEQRPWLSAYQSVKQHSYSSQAKISGVWPAELRGTLYRNGPAQHEIGSFRYQHWFDGDGMLQAFRISDEGVTHQAKMIATEKYIAESAARRALYPTFGTVPPNPAAVTSPDAVNVGNISVLPHHGKLLALWEAGSAWEMDADNLDTKGTYAFSDNMRGVPFSAHPRVDRICQPALIGHQPLAVCRQPQLSAIGRRPTDGRPSVDERSTHDRLSFERWSTVSRPSDQCARPSVESR